MKKRACSCELPNASNVTTGDLGTIAGCPCSMDSAPTHPYHAVELPRYHVEFAALDTPPVLLFSEAADAPLTIERRVTVLRSFASSPSSPRAPPFQG